MRQIFHTLTKSTTLYPSLPTKLLLQFLPFHTKSNQNQNKEEEDEEGKKFNGEANFRLHKSRGQHILINPRVLDSIVKKAHVLPTDTVLEIGPGTGNLTVRLLEASRRVVAVEIDHRMVDALQKRVEGLGMRDRLTVIAEDALKAHLPEFDLCVANIPYGISSPLIEKLLFGPTKLCYRSATILLQKEFAQRLMAKPGDSEFNRLAVNVSLVATVESLMNVSKKDFVPCPKVDSSLVQIRQRPQLPVVNMDEWLAFTRTCFGNKNKTLGAIFKQKKKIGELFRDDGKDGLEAGQLKAMIIGILKIKGYDGKRPSKMSHEEFLELLQLFNQECVLFNRKPSYLALHCNDIIES